MNNLQLLKAKNFLNRKSSILLTCLSAAGVISTAILAVRATPRALTLIERAECAKYKEDGHVDLSVSERIKVAWKCYIPAAASGAATIACIAGSAFLDRKKQAALIGVYATLNESYKNYRKTANEVFGEDADSKIRAEMAEPQYIYDPASGCILYDPEAVKDSEKPILFYDPYSDRFFRSTMAAVINTEYHVNRNIQMMGSFSLNDYYAFLGIEPVEDGHKKGWTIDELFDNDMIWLDFDHCSKTSLDGKPYYIIHTPFCDIVDLDS